MQTDIRPDQRPRSRIDSGASIRIADLSTRGAIYNTFNIQRHLTSRNTMRRFQASTMEECNAASAAGA